MKGKLNKNISSDNSLDYIEEIESKIDEEINKDIEEFYIDKDVLNKIEIPKDIRKHAIKPIKEIKKEKKKNIRYAILDMIIVIIILLPIIGVIKPDIFKDVPQVYSLLVSVNNTFKKDKLMSMLGIEVKKDPIEGDIESSKHTEYISEKDVHKPENSYDSVKLIHSLANTLVHAEYKWQCSEVTPNTIEKALKGVELIKDDYDRMHLRNSLTKWSKGNFSNSVEVHNYVWEMLDGSVGKAHTLDDKEIEKVKNKYYNNDEEQTNELEE